MKKGLPFAKTVLLQDLIIMIIRFVVTLENIYLQTEQKFLIYQNLDDLEDVDAYKLMLQKTQVNIVWPENGNAIYRMNCPSDSRMI